MQIQVHVHPSLHASVALEPWARSALSQGLARLQPQLSSLEAHLARVPGGHLAADPKRCTLQARLPGRDPLSVHHQAEHLDEALRGACDKLKRALERELDLQQDAQHRNRASIRRDRPPDTA